MASNYGTFVGKLKKPTGDKVKFVALAKNNENVKLLNASFVSDTSSVFVKMMGFKQDKIRVSLGKGESMEVAWDDRFDAKILEKVPNWTKTTLKIGEERKEFLSNWDAIDYLDEHYDEYADKQIQISVRWTKNAYNGEARDQFDIQGAYETKEGVKDKLDIKTIFWWNKDSIDDADWDSDKILRVNGYIKDYDRDLKKDIFFPQTIVLNCSKIDFNDEHQKALAEYRVNNLKTKASTFQECKMECRLMIGAEKKEDSDWDESMLTDAQKEQVALGLATVESFNPGGSTYGEFKTEYRFVNFDLTGDYANGIVDTGLTQEELDNELWSGAKVDDGEDWTDIDGKAAEKLEDLFV